MDSMQSFITCPYYANSNVFCSIKFCLISQKIQTGISVYWTENIRDNELLNVVDELLSHHDDEELLSQFNKATPGTTLQ